jgi:hypothetical protein
VSYQISFRGPGSSTFYWHGLYHLCTKYVLYGKECYGEYMRKALNELTPKARREVAQAMSALIVDMRLSKAKGTLW